MQICRKCGLSKAASEFYTSCPSQCKECVKARVHAHRHANLDRIQAYDRERGQLPEHKHAVLDRWPRYKASHCNDSQRWNERNPEARRAENVLDYAVHNGGIDKPDACSQCGKQAARINGFHHDVSKPLDVECLCDACLGAARRARNEERRQAQQEAS